MDLSETIQPDSQQLDSVDLLGGPRVFTIERVSKGTAEQPVQIHLAEFPRPWRPGKSMRRVLVACWGPDASQYVGRRVTLFCDPSVKFGGEKVGGTRISHLSHIDGPRDVPLLVTRGKSAIYTVQPLTEPTADDVTSCSDEGQLRAWWDAYPQLHTQIKARVAELRNEGGPLIPDHAATVPGGDQ